MIKLKIDDYSYALFSSETGLMESIESHGKEYKVKVSLITYDTNGGAYLFLPTGPAVTMDPGLLQWIRVESGNLLRNRVCVNMTKVLHCVEFYPTLTSASRLPSFSVWNVVDLRQSSNIELAVHIETDIQNDNTLFTDLNGFQYVKKKKYDKLTVQGNVYPMPSGAFIQDDKLRFNVLTAQPVGVASLHDSSIQMFLDRKTDQDDDLGLMHSLNDNLLAASRFEFFFERVNKNKDNRSSSSSSSAPPKSHFPSLMAQIRANNLLHPVVKMALVDQSSVNVSHDRFSRNILDGKIPCDLHLVNMRTVHDEEERPLPGQVALIVRRHAHDDCRSRENFLSQTSYVQETPSFHKECSSTSRGDFTFEDFFKTFIDQSMGNEMKVESTLLSLASREAEKDDSNGVVASKIRPSDNILDFIQPMNIEAFKVTF
jgi:alpha-mannosidase II